MCIGALWGWRVILGKIGNGGSLALSVQPVRKVRDLRRTLLQDTPRLLGYSKLPSASPGTKDFL
jgi:hypothetical protein